MEKSCGGLIAFVILIAIIASAGKGACMLLGGLLALGGFTQLGDGRRNPFTSFGLIAFGGLLLLIGFALK